MLRDLDPDVVCLQEAPRLLLWRVSRLLLARRAGLQQATTARAYGLAVLSAPAVRRLGSDVVAMPVRPGLHRRGLVVASLQVGGARLAVASTHLDLDATARLDSARRVREALPDGAVVLAGDVNEQPGGPAWEALGAGLVDARAGLGPTFPARHPDRHLDGVWVRGMAVTGARVVDEAGRSSDHLPVLVELAV